MSASWTSFENVARHVGVAQGYVFRSTDRCVLPVRAIGHLWKVEWTDFDAWARIGCAEYGSRKDDDG